MTISKNGWELMISPWIWFWKPAAGTMDRLHKPNFDYADKILQSWSEKKVHTLADVERLDQEHQKKNSTRKKPSAARATGFTNFQQRDYDFDKLEEMLLQSQK